MLDINNNWKISGCLAHKVRRDTLQFKEGKASAKIEVYSGHISGKNYLRIYQLLKVPTSAKEIKASFWMKSEKLTNSRFRITSLDSKEQLIETEEIPIHHNQNWTKVTGKIENKAVQMLYVEFEVGDNSSLWLDNFEILLDGKNFYNFTLTSEEIIKETELSKIKPLQIAPIDSDFFYLLKGLNSKKIIGIGETSHGVHEMAYSRNELTKDLISQKRCRLVILEAPELFAEHLNKYAQGDLPEEELFTAEDLKRAQFFNLSEEVHELLKWIKQFNDTSKQKVIVAGMDVSYEWQELLRNAFHKIRGNHDIKILGVHLQRSESDSMLIFMNENKIRMTSGIGKSKFDSIYAMTTKFNRFKTVYSSFFDDEARDSIMALNVIELTDKYVSENEKVVVCGHLTHLNKQKLDNSIIPSVGNYLSNQFNDKYFVLGLIVGKGYYQAYQISNDELNIHPLAPPVFGSIEYYSSQKSNKPFYLDFQNGSLFNNEIMLYRFTGGIPRNQQFFPGNLSSRVDAVISLPNGTPLHLLPIFKAQKKRLLLLQSENPRQS